MANEQALLAEHWPGLSAFALFWMGATWWLVRSMIKRALDSHDELGRRVNNLEAGKVDQQTFEKAFDDIRREIRENSASTQTRLDAIFNLLVSERHKHD